MASIPSNLTVIREDFRKPRSLSEIRASLLGAPTEYVMLVGEHDVVDVQGPLIEGVHYLATSVGTRRAVRYSRPVVPFDPLLLIQFNYIGSPIVKREYAQLFPDASVEPWHTVLVRALGAGASFGLVEGSYTIVEPWPRPQLSGAYAHFRTSFDPAAVMEAVPSVHVEEINQRPFYSLRSSRNGTVKAFCRNCSPGFIASLSALNVEVEQAVEQDFNRIKSSNAEYVAWFDGIQEVCRSDALIQLQIALEFPGVSVVSPKVVDDFLPASFHLPAFWLQGGIYSGFAPEAWMSRTLTLESTVPVAGHLTSHAIMRKLP